jgi:hypothetical protein
VPNRHNANALRCLIEHVEHPIDANANPALVSTGSEFDRVRRSWIACECGNCPFDGFPVSSRKSIIVARR